MQNKLCIHILLLLSTKHHVLTLFFYLSDTQRTVALAQVLHVSVPDLLILLDIAGAGGLMIHGCQRGEFVQNSFCCDSSSHVVKLQCAFGKYSSGNSVLYPPFTVLIVCANDIDIKNSLYCSPITQISTHSLKTTNRMLLGYYSLVITCCDRTSGD